MNKTVDDVLREHVARMREIAERDLRTTTRLAQLNSLLIYRTATANTDVDDSVKTLVERIILESGSLESGDATLPDDSGGGS